MVEPLLRMFRLTNTALDVLFYDVGAFTSAKSTRGICDRYRNGRQVPRRPQSIVESQQGRACDRERVALAAAGADTEYFGRHLRGAIAEEPKPKS
jgi:hypothetical protein